MSPVLILYRLFVYVGRWFATNWRRLVIKVEDIAISESVIYKSRCWKCKTPIQSVKTRYRAFNWLGNKWLGNKKCLKTDCKYFVCKKCGACLCDGPFSHNKSVEPVLTKWVRVPSGWPAGASATIAQIAGSRIKAIKTKNKTNF